MFARGGVVLVLHLEHNREEFGPIFRIFTVDKVAFRTGSSVVIFLEIGIREAIGSHAVELDKAMLLKGLANEFGAHLGL